jgi:hypothetical protein
MARQRIMPFQKTMIFCGAGATCLLGRLVFDHKLLGLAKAKARHLDGPSREPEGYKRSSDANNRQNGYDRDGCSRLK